MVVRNPARVFGVVLAAALVAGAAPSTKSAPPAPDEDASPQAADAPKGDVLPFVVPNGERPEIAAMRRWFAELDDSDATVREQARVNLMGMHRRDLPSFRRLVEESRPLAPGQAAVLRQLVTHVYLAGKPYETTNALGFLGVRMQPTSVRLPGADGVEQPDSAVGVVIVERMPGFVGARMLLDGDVILGIAERPNFRAPDVFEFAAVVQSFAPGTTVHFQILRQGQVIRLPVKLDPKPDEADARRLEALIDIRKADAEEYWDHEFAGVVRENIG